MSEEWRPVVGYEGRYEVSSHGRVRGIGSRSRGLRSPYVTSDGYFQYCLYVSSGKTKNYCAHTLVAAAFVGPRPEGMCVCHNDGDPSNNRLDNLRYDTPAANSGDMVRHGHSLKGEQSKNAKLTDSAVRRIRVALGRYRDIARNFGVSYTTIQKIKSGGGWTHV